MLPINDQELLRRLQLIAQMNRSPETLRRTNAHVREILTRQMQDSRRHAVQKIAALSGIAASILAVMGILTYVFHPRPGPQKIIVGLPSATRPVIVAAATLPTMPPVTEPTPKDSIQLEGDTGKRMLAVRCPTDQPDVRLYVCYPMVQCSSEKSF